MTFRGLVTAATLGFALLIAGCGGGSGRSGTDLVVTGVGPSAQLNGGDLAVFVMTITNAGQYTANNLSIRNSTIQISQPTLLISCTASGGAVCPSVMGATMTAPSMPAGASLVFQVSGNTNVGASGTISDIMSVQSDTNEVDANNNTATVSGSVVSNDVTVTGTAPAGPLVDGPATFTMVVTNTGPNTALNVGLVTTASTNVTVVPAAIVCTPTLGAIAPTLQADGITLLSPSIPLNGVLTCIVPVTVAQATNGFALVTMTATTLGDSRTSNNAGTASVQATLVNDLGVTGSGALVNELATFTMVVSNAGPSTATSVVITNTLGTNLTYAGAITCVSSLEGAVPPALQSSTTTVITLLAASIQLGETLTCSVPAAVPVGTSGIVSNTMALSTTDDPKTGNNSATAFVSAALTNNVSVVAETAAVTVPGGFPTTFKFDLGNTGPSTAFNVGLTNTLSSNLSYTGPVTCTSNGGSVPPAPFTISGPTATGVAPSILVSDAFVCSVPVMVTAGTNGTVASTFVATSTFDTLNLNNTATASTLAASADLGVSQTAPATVAAGSPTTFTATVANPRGGGTATNLVIAWTYTLPSTGTNIVFAAPTCVATGGATCPTVLGSSMTVPNLLTGASLVFTFVANTTSTDRGQISNTVSVSADGDSNSANNIAITTGSVVDSRNGTYSVFAADGKSYSLSIDFDAASYTMSGNGQTGPLSFALVNGDYVVSGNARFRLAQDLIVGGHNFGNGVLPFVAARSFVTSVAQIAGSYDLATRNVPASGAPATHAGTALVNGNTLSVCQSDTAQVAVVRNCDPASLKTYSLSVSGNGFTGISGTGEIFSFSVVNTGAAKVLLSAGTVPDGTSQQFRIGLVDSTGGLTYGPAALGPSTTGDWVTIALTNASPPSYAASGSTTADSASLVAINSGGPFSMVTGTSTTFSASLYVMQASPLIVVVGSSGFGGSTAASGLLQIALP